MTVVEGNQSTLRRMYSSALSFTIDLTRRVLGINLDFLRPTSRPLCTSGSCNEQKPIVVIEMHFVILRNKLFAS